MCLFVRDISLAEGATLQRTLRKSKNRTSLRRAQVILLSVQGMPVKRIAKVTYLHEVYVRELIRLFNRQGIKILRRRTSPGRPIEFTEEIRAEMVECALSPPRMLGMPFSRWSLDKLREYLQKTRVVKSISIERLRTILEEEGVKLQRTKTWKESNDPAFASKKND
ncbi:MAG: helix-turn-helix domain-containing protein [Ignavibacteria bacterium]|nr:helix-turn-helix domain-containing protein [Ignavibacteria bacterium]